MSKKFNDDYEEFERQDIETDFEDKEEPLEYSRHEGKGESVVEKPTIDSFFDTEALLYSIEKTMKGFQKRNGEWVYATQPLATDTFINKMINSLRSVINPQNMISYTTEDQAKFILLEKNKEFIFLAYDDEDLEDAYFETVVNMFDHALELFLGHTIAGFGARTFRQVSANVAYETAEQKKNDSLFSFGVGDKNIVRFGGQK